MYMRAACRVEINLKIPYLKVRGTLARRVRLPAKLQA